MIKLLEEIDEMLAAMECVAHGMEGRAITEMRGRIQTELSNSHKHSVMQAEGSAYRDCWYNYIHLNNDDFECWLNKKRVEATVADGAVGQNG